MERQLQPYRGIVDGATPLQLAFMESTLPLETRQFLLDRQIEPVQSLHDAFVHLERHYSVPDLADAEIWKYVLPKLWRLTEDKNE